MVGVAKKNLTAVTVLRHAPKASSLFQSSLQDEEAEIHK